MEQLLLSTSVEVLCETLLSKKIVDLICRRGVVTDELAKDLKIYLLVARILYYDAEENHMTSSDRKDLLVELKELVHDAEDLQERIENEALRSKHRNEVSRSTAWQVVNRLSEFVFPFGKMIKPEVVRTINGLERILKFRNVFDEGLQSRPSRRKPSTPTRLVVEETQLYGRDSDVETIVDSLMSHDVSGNKVTFIVGRDGIGKSAVAWQIFYDDRIVAHFDVLVWVSVSYYLDVLNTILKEVTGQAHYYKSDIRQLQVELKDALMGKNFLFVLDYDCNQNSIDWDILDSLSEFGENKSRIIMTTCCCEAVTQLRSIPPIIHHLNSISDSDDCWKLFEEHVFKGLSSDAPPFLELLAKQLVSKCEGIPFSIKFLGCLLRHERNPDEWSKILNDPLWTRSQSENGNILPVLWIGYFSLPQHLKQCLTHCSIFLPGYEIENQLLISLWMAQGLLVSENGKTMEEVGEEYLHDLKSTSFLQHSRQNESYFSMHPLVTHLVTYLSGQFCIRLEDTNCFNPVRKTRHFSYTRAKVDDLDIFEALSTSQRLRTFLPIGQMVDDKKFEWNDFFSALNKFFQSHPYLRVVSLSVYPTIIKLPDSIAILKNARYFDLSYTGIQSIPDAVCTLIHLQTFKLVSCKALIRLPSGMRYLINLRCLDTRGTPLEEMPPQMSNLKELQILTDFVLGKDSGSGIKELRNLQIVGGLCISGLQNVVVEDIVEANLGGKLKLTDLGLKWSGCANNSQYEHDVLDKLRPSTTLKSLSVHSYGGTRFPDWLGNPSFSILVSIRLTCGENCFVLPSLGQLPSLRELFIEGFGNVEVINDNAVTNPFPSLEILHFCNMPEWQVWLFPRCGAFLRLRDLSLKNCPKLTGSIPATVETPHIEGCRGLQVP